MRLTITARLDRTAISEILADLLPLTIDLSDEGDPPGDRWIRVEQPHHVDFVADDGLHVHTSAQLRWRAGGVRVPATLQHAELILRPQIARDERGPKLVFAPSLEKADFKLVPAFVDRRIVSRVNAQLALEGDRLAWHFGESLAVAVPMPRHLAPLDAFLLEPGAARVAITAEALELTLDLNVRFSRGNGGPDPSLAL